MFDHVLVPLGGSPLAECVLPHTVAVAQAFGAQVTLLQVLGGDISLWGDSWQHEVRIQMG